VGRIFGNRASVATKPRLAETTVDTPAGISADAGTLGSSGVTLLAASIRGLSHQSAGSVRQDSYAVAYGENSIVVAVADGVGSAELSHVGSAIAANTAVAIASEGTIGSPMIAAVIAQLRAEARRMGRSAEDLSTTLLIAQIQVGAPDQPWKVLAAEWGDSRLSVFSPGQAVDGHPNWSHICPDSAADLANTVQALPTFAEPTTFGAGLWLPGEVLLAATDGIDSHLMPENYVGHGLAEAWSEVPSVYQFIADVGFERAGARDDRTAVCLFRAPATPPSGFPT
jgi:hypothetical protein